MIIFDIKGKFAAFKKFYTNSSSLSYMYPPRTVIEGIIGSILGYDCDSYYEKFGFKNSIINVSLKSKVRSIMTTLNYLKIDNTSTILSNFLNNKYNNEEHTQIPFEIIVPDDFLYNIIYRIYFDSKDNDILKDLSNKLKNKDTVYPVALGNANMLASANFVSETQIEPIKCDDFIEVITPTPTEFIKKLKFEENIFIKKDIFPVDFNKLREPRTMQYVYEINGNQYKIQTDKKVLKVNYNYNGNNITDNILFPEVASDEFLFA